MKIQLKFLCWMLCGMSLLSCKNSKKASKESDSKIATKSHSTTEAKSSKNDSSLLISINQGGCHGTCPIYKMYIYQNGNAKFEGIHFVKNIGKYSAQLSKGLLDSLKDEIKQDKLFELKNEYVNHGIADLPTFILTVQQGKNKKTITAQYTFPKNLQNIHKYLGQLALNKIKWEKTPQ